jgi:hypothetical protein
LFIAERNNQWRLSPKTGGFGTLLPSILALKISRRAREQERRIMEASYERMEITDVQIQHLKNSLTHIYSHQHKTGLLQDVLAFSEKPYLNKEILGDKELNLFPRLVNFIDEDQHTSNLNPYVLTVLKCFWYLSRVKKLRIQFCHSDLKLIPLVINILENHDPPPSIREAIENLLTNCGVSHENHKYLFSLNLLPLWKSIILHHTPPLQLYRVLQSLNMLLYDMQKDDFDCYFLHSGLPQLMVERLFAYGVEEWGHLNTNHHFNIYWSFMNILEMSFFPSGAQYLKSLNVKSYFSGFLLPDNTEGIVSAMILLNIYGAHNTTNTTGEDDECNTDITHLLLYQSSFLSNALSILDFTLHPTHKEYITDIESLMGIELFHAVLTLRTVTNFLKNLSFFEVNLPIILKENRFYDCCYAILELFLRNNNHNSKIDGERAGYRDAGGGREDHYTLKNILTVLIQAIFFYNQERSKTENKDERKLVTVTGQVCQKNNEWMNLFETKFLKDIKWLQIMDSIVLLSQSPVFLSPSFPKDLEILLLSLRQFWMKITS